jgi:hypothetical protein
MSSARPWFDDAAGASAACMAWILLRRIDDSRLGCLLLGVFFTHEGEPASSRITY